MFIGNYAVSYTHLDVYKRQVLESGTQNGVITDVDGIFTIQLAKNASLTISYVGYQKKTVVVKDKKFISVNLTPDRSMMPVSYTHLDVYKRQIFSAVGLNGSTSFRF